MPLHFCPKCNKIITKIGTCSCGHIINELNISSSEIQRKKESRASGVIHKEKPKEGFPHKCKKCGHDECEVSEVGVSVSDEAGIYLFKCINCGYIERQADGSCNM